VKGLANAIAVANDKWTTVARPIVKAWLLLEEARCELNHAWVAASKAGQRVYDEAKGYTKSASNDLRAMLEGIRDNAYCDHCMGQLTDDSSDEEWDIREEYNDALQTGIMSVDAFISMVEDEA